ncbi:uncharacterized protein LOC127655287 [Xyrauchen texanus]|uniref:uncharacterized protein LOC127655287 n=1 Tax=Xyrauchen texanus TaxID=154827 RepID=UPI002242AF6A|nr:uncharacterized protein LOC127655287 [Xyrauchen texanus]
MLECNPDWAPSLYLGHTEVKATNTERFKWFRRTATSSQQQQPPSLGTDNTGPEAELEAHMNQPLSPGTDHTGPEAELEALMNQPPSPGTDHTGPEAELDNAAPLYPDNTTPATSKKQNTENCGFLQKLSPGDLVLADCGFYIKESVALVGATLKIPAFTRGHHQFNAKNVEQTRKLAHVRIHMERVIGCMRSKFNILNDTIRLGFVVPCEGEDKTAG